MRSSSLLRPFAALALAASALASAPLVASATVKVSGPRALVQAAPALPLGARVTGPLSPSSQLHFDLQLRMHNGAAFTSLLKAVTSPTSPLYRHYLSRGEFARLFGATTSQIAAVDATVAAGHLRVLGVSSNRLFIRVQGSVKDTARFFSTAFAAVRLSSGQRGWMTTTSSRIPANIAGAVQSVVGLDNLVSAHNDIARTNHIVHPSVRGSYQTFAPVRHLGGLGAEAPSACASAQAATQAGYGGITQDQIAQAYGIDGLYNLGDYGAGQTVAIYELEPYLTSDIQTFEQCYFGADHTNQISNVTVDGGAGVGPGSAEAALDIENVAALAPQANIIVYTGTNTTYGALDTYNQIVADDAASTVSTSWGLCESALANFAPGALAAEHLIFEEAAAQGQTVFSASGDAGNDDCAGRATTPTTPTLTVDDPSSQPYVVGVGGTTALSVSANPTQQVWNDGNQGGASGGGISNYWTQPAWMPQNADTSGGSACGALVACRTVPDVSAYADEYTGVTIAYAGGWYTIGGTSSAAPQWAAMLAEINASPTCTATPSTSHGVGFAAPLFYQVASSPTAYASGFTDVTTGNNDIFGATAGLYRARAGYDLASGLGSPNLTPYVGAQGPGLATSMCDLAQGQSGVTITGDTPSAVSVGGGQVVTVTGTGFESNGTPDVAGVYFGATLDYDVTVLSNTELTVVSPAIQNDTSVSALLATTAGTGNEPLTVLTTGGALSSAPPSGLVSVHLDSATGAPVLTQVGPTGGTMAGGSIVRLYCTGFTGATAVTFGGVPATFTVVSDNIIEATAPAVTHVRCAPEHMSGLGLCQAQVVVVGATGLPSATAPIAQPLTGQLSFSPLGVPQAPANCNCEALPSLTEYDYSTTSITGLANLLTGLPSGSPLGGDTVAITGSGINILSMNYIAWGPSSAQSSLDTTAFFWSPDGHEVLAGSLAAPAPSSSPTSVPVSIVTVAGETTTLPWTYRAEPFVSSVSTAVLPSSGGATVTLTGAGLSTVAGIVMTAVGTGNNPSLTIYPSNFTIVNDSTITLTSPSAVPGNYVFTVCSVDHACNTSMNQGSNPAADSVVVVYPGQEAITSISDPNQPGQLATVGVSPYTSDELLVQGVNLSPSNDVVSFVTKGGDVVATSSVVAPATPTDPGATSAYLVSAPQLPAGTAPQELYVIVTNSVTGVSTTGTLAASVIAG